MIGLIIVLGYMAMIAVMLGFLMGKDDCLDEETIIILSVFWPLYVTIYPLFLFGTWLSKLF